jgi:hypothetical protein
MRNGTTELANSDENPNTNSLKNKRCPRCGSLGPFEVVVSMWVLLHDDGADYAENGSMEYDGSSPARCSSCNHQAEFRQFDAG